MQESTKQIVIAVAASAAAAATAAIITHWLTKDATTKDIASGKTPLPAGSTPTTNGPPIVATPVATPTAKPAPAPAPAPVNLLNLANQINQGVQPVIPKCPVGYHAVATGQPNFPWMCVQDS